MQRCRLCGFRLVQRLAAEDLRNAVRVNGDQADGALALERAEPLDDAAGRQAETRRAAGFDRDQVAVLGVVGGARRNGELLAEHLLVDRLQPAAAVRQFAENPEHAVLGMVDDLDDAARAGLRLRGGRRAQQHAVAEPGGFAGARLARRVNADFRRRPVRVLVPFVGRGDQLAVGIARGDVGEHGGGQRAGVMQLLAPLLDRALVGEVAQHALELGARAFFRPKARAISRVPTLPGRSRMKARRSALEGREGALAVFCKMVFLRQFGA